MMHSSWAGDAAFEVQLHRLLCNTAPPLNAAVARWLPGPMEVPASTSVPSPNDQTSWYRYQKLGRLLHFVSARAREGDADAVLRSIEDFVGDANQRWLKVAGGAKSEVVAAALDAAALREGEVALEMGCFVGYTAIRLGHLVSERHLSKPGLVSTEMEALHLCISRHHVDLAQLSTVAEVWAGHIPWATPRYVEQFGDRSVPFTFMDHKGTRFHEDFRDCRISGVLCPNSLLLCDNVLKPGAPVHLWRHHRTASPGARLFSLTEFREPDMEDWQSLLYNPPPTASAFLERGAERQ
ncbi:Comt [Symbiodinium natans]|uniref:Comt protein n=1 Tax=Symbiodinium natans TaxID=878477 RepID=A0A812PH31_9DINO|nr:Comt [Symbiodinium natans]